eukprot:3473943-Pyramimonas_sp.AAC.1
MCLLACCPDRMSGSDTTSMSPDPARFRSRSVRVGCPSWVLLPVSISSCTAPTNHKSIINQ